MVRYYTVGYDHSKRFKKIDSARKYAIKTVRENEYYEKANVSTPITDDKNRHIGDVYVQEWINGPRAIWVTHYYKFNENRGINVLMSRRRELNLNGTLRKQ